MLHSHSPTDKGGRATGLSAPGAPRDRSCCRSNGGQHGGGTGKKRGRPNSTSQGGQREKKRERAEREIWCPPSENVGASVADPVESGFRGGVHDQLSCAATDGSLFECAF